MKLSLQTQILKKRLLNLCELKHQYVNGSVSLLDKIAELRMKMPKDLYVDTKLLSNYIGKFCSKNGEQNYVSDVVSYYSGNIVYPSDIDNVFAYNEKNYKYYLDIGNISYEFPMGNWSDRVSLETLLFDNATNSMSRLVIDYPQLLNYIMKAYEDTKIARIESEKATLIRRLLNLEEHAEELQDDIINLDRQLPIGVRIRNYASEVFNLKK